MCWVDNKRMLELKQNSNCVSIGRQLNRRYRSSAIYLKLKQNDTDKDMTEMF